ncbi:zona pellucida sperm-binding protein 3-like [Bombina bombina]|uniref:zona pellucida sperm-binding protein 3-like n=1 Tax=Bombina bombina TaxID=8345 RepID=UPI00235B155B|nr:zona pellucida sperm-binding protein 3-like [Bombina bombina]
MSLWEELSWLLYLMVGVIGVMCQKHAPARRPAESGWSNYPPRSGVRSAQHLGRSLAPVYQQRPISVHCQVDNMVVTVQRDLYGNGKLLKASDLTLGPLRCPPSPQTTDSVVVFQNGLQECGISLKITTDFLIYSTDLTYNPTPSANSSIVQKNAGVLLIQCYYSRHQNVSSNAIQPTWFPFSSTVSAEETLSFTLELMNDDWSAPRTSTIFQLGDAFHIEASVGTANHVLMTVFVDSCVATLSPDANSNPHYDLIALNGCLLDGKQEDSSSAFRSPRSQPDKIQFAVDVFRFPMTNVSTIYITCKLKATAATQTPDPMNKACSFSKINNTWSPLEGISDICMCCDTGNCVDFASQTRRVSQYYPGGRRVKRQANPDPKPMEEYGIAILGPLLVIKQDYNKSLAVLQDSLPVLNDSNLFGSCLFITVVSLNAIAIIALIVIFMKYYIIQLNKTVEEFVTDLRLKSRSCNYGPLQESLIGDRLVIGCNSNNTRERLLIDCDLTLQKAVSICQSAEQTKKQLGVLCKQDSQEIVNDVRTHRPSRGNSSPYLSERIHKNKVDIQDAKHKDMSCGKCGKIHEFHKCPAYGQKCRICKKYNHFASQCKQARQLHAVKTYTSSSSDDDLYVDMVTQVPTKDKEWIVEVEAHGAPIPFKVDTGADPNVIPEALWKKLQLRPKRQKQTEVLKAYNGLDIPTVGHTHPKA